MIKKEFSQKTKILAVQLVVLPIYLVNTEAGLAVYLLASWLPYLALPLVVSVSLLKSHILQTELTDPQFWTFSVLLWVGGEVPGINLKLSNLNSVNVFNLDIDNIHHSKKT